MNPMTPVILLIAAVLSIWKPSVALGATDLHLKASQADLNSVLKAVRSATEPTNCINLPSGIYFLSEPLRLAETDRPLLIQAESNVTVVLSGGRRLTDWQPVTKRRASLPPLAQTNIWQTSIPKADGHYITFRQLWINGKKAVRARNPSDGQFFRLTGWNKTNHTAAIPTTALAGIKSPGDLEMVINQVWEIAVLRVESLSAERSNTFLTFKQPEGKIEFEHPWPPVIVTTNYQAPFYLVNAIEFLDSPGEWFADFSAGKIYYWPRAGEDMLHAETIVPVLENLLTIEGSLDRPARGIHFKGITFAHTTWRRPAEMGHVPLQAGMFLLDAKKLSPKGTPYHRGLDNLAWIGRPPAAVTVKNASDIIFENCSFEHLAATGLDFESGTCSNLVQGCTFSDIGGNGLQIGEFSQPDVETHVPFNPSDYRVICSHETIANNRFRHCGTEDWGCMGICVGYARNITIHNNKITQMPYTGISVGWGWTKHLNASRDNQITGNHIHDVGQILGDLGGIYTLSAQPGTVIAENYIHDITPSLYAPDTNHWFYLYLDEGSSYITVRDNWCPSEKFLKNANGPGNIWTNNGPQVSEAIKTAAGPKF